jgi:DNA-binding CsgD family transcriptional regulator
MSGEDDVYLVAPGVSVLADWVDAAPAGLADRLRPQAAAAATRWIDYLPAQQRDGRQQVAWVPLERAHITAQLERLHGRSDPERWARVASGPAELGMPYEGAHARYRCAEALAGVSGRTSASRRAPCFELATARAIAGELPSEPPIADIDGLARRARLARDPNAAPDQHPHDSRHDLLEPTPRELDVLALLARGRSNGHISKDLFISTKTASTHVSNIIGKLGVTNRVEAAAVAAQHSRIRP